MCPIRNDPVRSAGRAASTNVCGGMFVLWALKCFSRKLTTRCVFCQFKHITMAPLHAGAPVRSPAGLFKYVICTGKTLTSLWYKLSQGKLHSLVTLMQRLWSSDTGSTSSAFLDSEDWIVLPEGSQMVSLFCFCLSLSLSLPASPPHNVHLNIWQLTHDTRTYSCSFTTSW